MSELSDYLAEDAMFQGALACGTLTYRSCEHIRCWGLTVAVSYVRQMKTTILATSKTKTQPMQSDRALGELMLHVASKCAEHPKFGATKLNKILFFSDFLAFRRDGNAITGATYMKLKHGPGPRRLLPVQERLLEEKAAAIQERAFLAGTQRRLVALRPANLDLFTAPQIELVQNVIDAFRDATAEQVSEFSHSKIWEAADENEEIPYEAVFISDEEGNSEDLERGASLAKEHRWDG